MALTRFSGGRKSYPLKTKLVGFEKLPVILKKSFESGLGNAQENTRKLLSNVYDKTDYLYDENGKCSFKGFFITLNNNADASTLVHELFHKADYDYGNKLSKALSECIKKDSEYLKVNASAFKGLDNYISLFHPDSLDRNGKMKNDYRAISDIINGMTKGEVSFGYGHKQKGYWERKNQLEKETWAQFGKVTYDNNDDVVKMFQDMFPNTYQTAVKELEKIVKKL